MKASPTKLKKRLARKAVSRATRHLTCGDMGGVMLDGRPCRHIGGALCPQHDDAARVSLQAQKERFLAEFAKGTVSALEAARLADTTAPTVWRWRQIDPVFDAALTEAQERSDRVRVALIEDSLFKRSVAGDAAAAETIFFLKNRHPKRWRDRIEHDVSGNININVQDARERIARRIDRLALTN